MAKRLTIESCLNEEPHQPHPFRPAIFGIGRKVHCPGIQRKTQHRCHLRYAPVHSDEIVMTWRCKKPGCRVWHCALRSVFNHQTLGVPLDWFITEWDR